MIGVDSRKECFLDALRDGGLADNARSALEAVRDNTCFVAVSATLLSLRDMDLIVAVDPCREHTCGWRITSAGLHVLMPTPDPAFSCPRCRWPDVTHPMTEHREGALVHVIHHVTCPVHEGWSPPQSDQLHGPVPNDDADSANAERKKEK